MHFISKVLFSAKRERVDHPVLVLGNNMIERKVEHKDLGLIVHARLNFNHKLGRQTLRQGKVLV